MEQFKDFRKSGTFKLSSDIEVPGELSLNMGATTLDLYSSTFFNTHKSTDIAGTLHDRTKVSLIGCITTSGPGTGIRGKESYHFSSVFPHFVLLGNEHITSTDRLIVEINFSIDDASSIFYDFDVFGEVIDARPHLEKIVEAEKKAGLNIEFGEYPRIFYFTGKFEIFSVDTVLGTISAKHGISYTSPGPEGIHVRNTIRVSIVFLDQKTVDEAIRSVMDTLRFLEVIAGRPQNVVELSLRLTSVAEEEPRNLAAYWCLPPRRAKEDESRRPHPADLPLQAGQQPEKFAAVLARWLVNHEEWRNARERYSTASAQQNRYGTDRLVGAANMFDVMPSTAFPATVEPSSDLKRARDETRNMFRALPSTPERDSVLNALGRIGKPTLKRKIHSRVKLITSLAGRNFPDLELVTNQAVDCRNFYVHGTPGKFDYDIHLDQVRFFTDTLEFVFAAADLIDAGWNIVEWIVQRSTMSHPFGRFCVNYAERLAALKALLH